VADAVYRVADLLELRVFFEVEENPEAFSIAITIRK
jgi:hypothetical protein